MRYNQGRELRVVGSHIFGCNAGFPAGVAVGVYGRGTKSGEAETRRLESQRYRQLEDAPRTKTAQILRLTF